MYQIDAKTAVALILAAGLYLVSSVAGAEPLADWTDGDTPAKEQAPLTLDPRLQPRVDFWVKIYSEVTADEVLLHDRDAPEKIYAQVPRVKAAATRAKTIKILNFLAQNETEILQEKRKLTREQREIWDLFKDDATPDRFRLAARPGQIHMQGGLIEQAKKAIYLSGRYLPWIERVFAEKNVPPELAYLPFVESSFNRYAFSKTGAKGIWQFMPATGREFLREDEAVDERNDPMRSAEAAALLLQQNYEALKSWPLAITAYNHGRLGMQKAVEATGSRNLASIIASYHGPFFSFASANYYASFLAAKQVVEHAEKYFGVLPKAKAMECDEFILPDYVDFHVLAEYLGIATDDLQDLNPALSDQVFAGKLLVPMGYTLRVPMYARTTVISRYEKIPAPLRQPAQITQTAQATVQNEP